MKRLIAATATATIAAFVLICAPAFASPVCVQSLEVFTEVEYLNWQWVVDPAFSVPTVTAVQAMEVDENGNIVPRSGYADITVKSAKASNGPKLVEEYNFGGTPDAWEVWEFERVMQTTTIWSGSMHTVLPTREYFGSIWPEPVVWEQYVGVGTKVVQVMNRYPDGVSVLPTSAGQEPYGIHGCTVGGGTKGTIA